MKPQSFRVIEGDGGTSKSEAEGLEHIGAFLREARVSTGGNLADIAVALRIRPKFLQAIEDGRFEDLPGTTYAAGFIRSYADYLGLDTESLLARFRQESRAAEAGPDLDFPAPSPVGWFPTGKVVASCAILAAALFAGWYYLQSDDATDVASIPAPPGYQPGAGTEPQAGAGSPAAPTATADTSSSMAASVAPVSETEENVGQDFEAADVATARDGAAAEAADAPVDVARQGSEAVNPVAAVATPENSESQSEPQPAEPAEAREVGEQEATPATEEATVPAADAAATPAPKAKPAVTEIEVNEAAPTVVSGPDPVPAPILREPESPLPASELPVIPADDSAAATTSGGGRVFGASSEQARVVIGAKDDSWVQVLDEEQNVVLTRLLRAGDRYLVPNRRDLVMLTGNAGGLIISVDGEPVPQIGSDGAILHNVRLDAEALKEGRAVIR